RVPEERRRHLSTAGGLPLELLMEETHASRRFRKVRGLGGLEAIARAVAVDRIDVGFVDILPCEGCLDHPLLGPRNELFRRREIVGATEPARARGPVVEEAVARGGRASEVARSDRTHDACAVLFVDLDNFKQVNDRFGHEAGNDVLKSAARECSAHIRTTDLAARYGGDEFVMVLVHTGVEGARVVADKVRTGVEVMGRDLGYPEGLVTVSIGVAELAPGRGPEREDVLVEADGAPYRP